MDRGSRSRGWNAAVLISAVTLVVPALALAVDWVLTQHSRVTSYSVSAPLTEVDVQLASGTATIVGTSSPVVQVRRDDDYSFGHSAREQRSISGGVLHIVSRCPRIVLGNCSASYELTVPESVAVNVRTTAGELRVSDYRGRATLQTESGRISVDAYCGFSLAASSKSGDMRIATACSPQSLTASSRRGNVVALVPPGRYRISASSGAGREQVRGLVPSSTAPFAIDARSGQGSVTVGAGL